MARPRKKIDPEQVKQLAMIQCSNAEMAAVLGCSHDVLERRFASAIKEGREHGKSSLKRAQYKLAMNGNATMLIWLGKQHLDQKDKTEYSGDSRNPIVLQVVEGNPDQNGTNLHAPRFSVQSLQ